MMEGIGWLDGRMKNLWEIKGDEYERKTFVVDYQVMFD